MSPANMLAAFKEGLLTKQGIGIKNWKVRWFVLTSDRLYYFESKTSSLPLGEIRLKNCGRCIQGEEAFTLTKKPFSFCLHTSYRVYKICASDEKQAHSWCLSINQAMALLFVQQNIPCPISFQVLVTESVTKALDKGVMLIAWFKLIVNNTPHFVEGSELAYQRALLENPGKLGAHLLQLASDASASIRSPTSIAAFEQLQYQSRELLKLLGTVNMFVSFCDDRYRPDFEISYIDLTQSLQHIVKEIVFDSIENKNAQTVTVKTAHFGVDLEKLAERDGLLIPKFFKECAEYVKKHGTKEEGIMRVSAPKSSITSLREIAEDGKDLKLEENKVDVNSVTCLMKLFIKELPNPVIPKLRDFERINELATVPEKIKALQAFIRGLPSLVYREFLKEVVSMCHHISKYSVYTKMDSKNLATVIAPSLLASERLSMLSLVNLINNSNQVFAVLIDEYEEVFGIKEKEKEEVLYVKEKEVLQTTPVQTARPRSVYIVNEDWTEEEDDNVEGKVIIVEDENNNNTNNNINNTIQSEKETELNLNESLTTLNGDTYEYTGETNEETTNTETPLSVANDDNSTNNDQDDGAKEEKVEEGIEKKEEEKGGEKEDKNEDEKVEEGKEEEREEKKEEKVEEDKENKKEEEKGEQKEDNKGDAKEVEREEKIEEKKEDNEDNTHHSEIDTNNAHSDTSNGDSDENSKEVNNLTNEGEAREEKKEEDEQEDKDKKDDQNEDKKERKEEEEDKRTAAKEEKEEEKKEDEKEDKDKGEDREDRKDNVNEDKKEEKKEDSEIQYDTPNPNDTNNTSNNLNSSKNDANDDKKEEKKEDSEQQHDTPNNTNTSNNVNNNTNITSVNNSPPTTVNGEWQKAIKKTKRGGSEFFRNNNNINNNSN